MAVLTVAFATAMIVGVSYLLSKNSWAKMSSKVLIVAGTIPPTVLGVFLYAVLADHDWAIRGPGLFADLGGGPAMLFLFTIVIFSTIAFWTISVFLERK